MEEICTLPLEDNFYKAKEWKKNILDFYAVKKNTMPVEALEKPIERLVESVNKILIINKNWPQDSYGLLMQTTHPLWDPEDYRIRIIKSLSDRAVAEKEERLGVIADNLLYIRRIFEQDKQYIESQFKREIELSGGNVLAYSLLLQKIFKTHIAQITRLLKERK